MNEGDWEIESLQPFQYPELLACYKFVVIGERPLTLHQPTRWQHRPATVLPTALCHPYSPGCETSVVVAAPDDHTPVPHLLPCRSLPQALVVAPGYETNGRAALSALVAKRQ